MVSNLYNTEIESEAERDCPVCGRINQPLSAQCAACEWTLDYDEETAIAYERSMYDSRLQQARTRWSKKNSPSGTSQPSSANGLGIGSQRL